VQDDAVSIDIAVRLDFQKSALSWKSPDRTAGVHVPEHHDVDYFAEPVNTRSGRPEAPGGADDSDNRGGGRYFEDHLRLRILARRPTCSGLRCSRYEHPVMALLPAFLHNHGNPPTSSRTVACSFVYVECKSRHHKLEMVGLHFIKSGMADRRLQCKQLLAFDTLASARPGASILARSHSQHRQTHGVKGGIVYSLPPGGNRKSASTSFG